MARICWPNQWHSDWPNEWHSEPCRHGTHQGESIMTDLLYYTLATPDGPFAVIESADGTVHASGWSNDVAAVHQRASLHDDPVLTNENTPAGEAVRAYYDGDLSAIDAVPVQHSGTALQRTVWEQLRAITPGEPLTYGQLAEKIGRPRAFRAVAGACGRNAIALFVPCHRVVASDGKLAGFAWGVDIKARLLDREAGTMPQD